MDPHKVDLGQDVDDEVLQLGPPAIEQDENVCFRFPNHRPSNADDRLKVDEDDAGDAQVPFNFSGLDADDSLDLVASSTLSESSKTFLIESAVRRIFAAGSDGAAPAVWVPLVSRLITRGLRPESDDEDSVAGERREALRQVMFDFVVEDMQSRSVVVLVGGARRGADAARSQARLCATVAQRGVVRRWKGRGQDGTSAS